MRPPLFLFQHKVDIRGFVSNDAYGEKVYTNINTIDPSMIISSLPNGNVTIKCRFEPRIQTNRAEDQEQRQYVATLFTLGSDIPPQSTAIYEGKKYIVQECIKHTDLRGISYLEVLLQ